MPAYVAMIRAIGPVTHAKMRMAALRDACAALGLGDVVTVGNTGNVLFRWDEDRDAARALVQAAVAGFGLGPGNEVFVRTAPEMAEVVAADPFPAASAERPATVGVCSFAAAVDWAPVLAWAGPERLVPVGAHLVVDYADRASNSKLRIEKLLGATMTQRNWRVFAGLAERVAAA